MSTRDARVGRFGVLLVCTGNRCRSPMAAALVRHLLRERFGAAAASFDVAAAGTSAVPGTAIDALARAELTAMGIEAAGLPSAGDVLSPEMIETADLVLTAERSHRSAVVQLVPTALGKSFCIREFARLMAAVDCRDLPSEPAALARAAVAIARDYRGLLLPVPASEEEIPDPFGHRGARYRRTAEIISESLARIVGVPPPSRQPRRWPPRPFPRPIAPPPVNRPAKAGRRRGD